MNHFGVFAIGARRKAFPGNRYFRVEGEKFIFQQLLPLEAEGREGQLHRGICPITKWPDNWKGGSQEPVIYVCEA